MQSLQPKAIFTLQDRVVLYRGEGLCNQQTKVAEEINNTLNQRIDTVTFCVLINAPDMGHQSRAKQPQNSTCPWTQGCDRDSIEMSRLCFTSWQILDPPSEEDWPWRQEDAVGHAVLCDSKENLWYPCLHMAHCHVKSPVKMIKAFRVGHSLVLVGFPWVIGKLMAEGTRKWGWVGILFLNSVGRALTRPLNGRAWK